MAGNKEPDHVIDCSPDIGSYSRPPFAGRERRDSAGGGAQGHTSARYQLRSWIDPTGGKGSRPDHVASFYFTAKSRSAREHIALIAELARAYSQTAKGRGGLHGAVIGHADAHPSRESDSVTVSRDRAFGIATKIKQCLTRETQIDVGRFCFAVGGADLSGCDSDPAGNDQAGGRAKTARRRVDVFITGGVTELPPKYAPPRPGPSGVARTTGKSHRWIDFFGSESDADPWVIDPEDVDNDTDNSANNDMASGR